MQLKPLYGDLVDRLWRTWMMEDSEGKKEIEQLVQQMHMEALRRRIDDEGIFLNPPPADKAEGEYPVGTVIYHNQSHDIYGIREDEWLQHVAILGRSGSGKTNLAYMLLGNLLQRGKPFLIFDWKRNYRPIIEQDSDNPVLIYTVGSPTVPFSFNPLIPPQGTEPTAWLKKLIEILAKATFVGEGVMYLLQQGLDSLYQKHGVYDGSVTVYPTMNDLVDVIQEMTVKGRAANWMASTQRALSALSFGAMGNVLNTQSNAELGELLKHPVILELDSLTSTDKVFFIESLLLWIHHYRLSLNEKREEFRHCIIIEEAHHILKKQVTGSSESVTEMLLREIRELGESIVLIDQHPSQISLQAIGNTYTTFTMNLKSKEDVNAACAYLLLDGDEKKYLNRLEVGQAIVKMQGRWTKPFLILVPFIEQKHRVVSDGDIQIYMKRVSADFGWDTPGQSDSNAISMERLADNKEKEPLLSELEQAFIQDIQSYPLTGVVQRYKRLGLSRRKGNHLKEGLQSKQLIEPVEIVTRKGKVVLLDLSNQKERPKPGIIHEYWKEAIAELYRSRGYTVEIEKELESGESVDIVVSDSERSIAIEIETGKSDYHKNAAKCLASGFDQVRILGADISATHHIHSKLSEQLSKHPNILFIGNCADENPTQAGMETFQSNA